jgi:hypothetical protein
LRDFGIGVVESGVYGDPQGHKRDYHPDWWKRRAR